MAFTIILDSLHSIQICSEDGELGGLCDEQKQTSEKQALQQYSGAKQSNFPVTREWRYLGAL